MIKSEKPHICNHWLNKKGSIIGGRYEEEDVVLNTSDTVVGVELIAGEKKETPNQNKAIVQKFWVYIEWHLAKRQLGNRNKQKSMQNRLQKREKKEGLILNFKYRLFQ